MVDLLVAVGLPPLLMLSGLGGWKLRAWLGEQHRNRDSVDGLRVILSMTVTFAALVLGLLTSSAKSDFDAQQRTLSQFSVCLVELDQRLREYGPDADAARLALRRYTAATILNSWPGEPEPPGDYPRYLEGTRERGLENTGLGGMLLAVDKQLGAMVPVTPAQQRLAAVLGQDMSAVLQERWQLIAGTGSGVSWPFLSVLLFWLTLAFFTFGLSTPPSLLQAIVLGLTAASVGTAVYLIVDFNTPLSGLLRLTSASLRDALVHMDAVASATVR